MKRDVAVAILVKLLRITDLLVLLVHLIAREKVSSSINSTPPFGYTNSDIPVVDLLFVNPNVCRRTEGALGGGFLTKFGEAVCCTKFYIIVRKKVHYIGSCYWT